MSYIKKPRAVPLVFTPLCQFPFCTRQLKSKRETANNASPSTGVQEEVNDNTFFSVPNPKKKKKTIMILC